MLKVLSAGLLITALFNFLVFNSQPGIGFSLFVVVINAAVLALVNNFKNGFLACIFGLTSAVFALFFSYRSNGVIQLIDLGAMLFFLLLNIYFSRTNLKFDFSYFNFLKAPFTSVISFIEGIFSSFTPQTWAAHSTKKHITSSVMRGFLMGIPLLVILFFILSRADPVFENITFSFLEDVWIRIIFSAIIFVATISLGVMKITEPEPENQIHEVSAGKEYELLVILGGLALLFGGFIFIQFKYLFSGDIGERELVSLGIKSLTFSEYVRKGFFELLLVSSLSAGVILYALRYIHKLKGTGKLLVQIFTSIVTIEVGLLLWSAAQRVFLYQEAHGLTRARIFGMFFLVWLAVLLVILLLKIVKDFNNKLYLGLNIVSTILILAMVNLISVDGLIATHEHKPTVNNEIDYYYLSHLSPDAHQSWVPAITEAEKVYLNLKDKQLNAEEYRLFYWHYGAIESLSYQVDYLTDKYGSVEKVQSRHSVLQKSMDANYASTQYKGRPLPEGVYTARKWQSWNLGEYVAHEYIEENQEQFNKLPKLLEGLRFIMSNVPQEVVRSTVLDRSTNPPLSR